MLSYTITPRSLLLFHWEADGRTITQQPQKKGIWGVYAAKQTSWTTVAVADYSQCLLHSVPFLTSMITLFLEEVGSWKKPHVCSLNTALLAPNTPSVDFIWTTPSVDFIWTMDLCATYIQCFSFIFPAWSSPLHCDMQLTTQYLHLHV